MEAINRMGTFSYYAIYSVIIFASLFPVISFFGSIFTVDGRRSIASNKWIILYYLIFFPFAYLFWVDRGVIIQYSHIGDLWVKILYIVLCFAPILKTDAVE
jgi:hypothetical protein